MEVAVVALSISCAVLALSTAVLAGSVPYIYWKCWRLESDLHALDEVVSGLCEAAGVAPLRRDTPHTVGDGTLQRSASMSKVTTR
jgi:hypothetical protein